MTMENPYAAPQADVAPASLEIWQRPDPDRLGTARRRLASHVADEARRAADLESAGARFTMPLKVSALALLASGAAAFLVEEPVGPLTLGLIAFVFFVVFGVRDLLFKARSGDVDPLVACRQHLTACRTGRDGYVLASLAPTAREQSARTPDLSPVRVEEGTSTLGTKKDIKDFFRRFLRPGHGQFRWVKAAKPKLVSVEGDLAFVSTELTIHSVPQWAYSLAILLFVLIRLVGIIALVVVMNVMKKTAKVTVTKTLLRGDDGLWYVLQGDWEGELTRRA